MVDYRVEVSKSEERRLNEFLRALRTPCKVKMLGGSPFNSASFENEFRSNLLTHHCFMGSPLFMDGFDSAFKSACIQAGKDVQSAPDGQRFWI